MRARSTSAWSSASKPCNAGAITSLTLRTAFNTPLPPYRFLSPSRSSTASCSPVEAPDGTAARPISPPARTTSASTVGLPRESSISRPRTCSIQLIIRFPFSVSFDDLQFHTHHATLFNALNFKHQTVVLDHFSRLEHVARFRHQEAADSRVSLRLGHRQFQTPVEITHGQSAVEHVRSVIYFHDLLVDFLVMLVRDLAHDLFQQIFERDDAFEPAVFVDYKSKMHLRLLHLAQDGLKPRSINDVHRRLQNVFEPEFFRMKQIRHHVLAVYKAADVVERLPVNGQA